MDYYTDKANVLSVHFIYAVITALLSADCQASAVDVHSGYNCYCSVVIVELDLSVRRRGFAVLHSLTVNSVMILFWRTMLLCCIYICKLYLVTIVT